MEMANENQKPADPAKKGCALGGKSAVAKYWVPALLIGIGITLLGVFIYNGFGSTSAS